MPTRAEHRLATLRSMSDAAIDLFAQQGPHVTVDEIAEAAGMARRTVFRWVESKDQLAYIHPLLWFDVFEQALDKPEIAAEPVGERLRRASRAIAIHIDADPEPPRRAFAVVAQHPELQSGFSAILQRWIDRIASEVLADAADPSDPETRFRARIVGSAVMGMVDAVLREWVFADDRTSFVDLYDRGFDIVAHLVEDAD